MNNIDRLLLIALFSFIIVVFTPKFSSSQIWSEDFSSYPEETGIDGTGNIQNYPDSISKWTLDVSNADLSGGKSDYFKIMNGKLEACDVDGPVSWISESIDISEFNKIKFSMLIHEDGDLESNDYVDLFYKADDSTFRRLTSWEDRYGDDEHTLIGDYPDDDDWTSLLIYKKNIIADSLKLMVKMNNNSGTEYIQLDEVVVEQDNIKPEPSNHALNFTGSLVNDGTIQLSFEKNEGQVKADGYLIIANTMNISEPSDGKDFSEDKNLFNDTGLVKLTNDLDSFSFSGCKEDTTYNFKLYPYTNYGADIDYKTDGDVPTVSISTGNAANIIISEIADPSDNHYARFVEIFNADTVPVELDDQKWNLAKQTNGGNWYNISLNGKIYPGELYVVGYTRFTDFYSCSPDAESGYISGNGDDGYFLFKGGNHETGVLVDSYGKINVDGTGTSWEYTDMQATRKAEVEYSSTEWTEGEWIIQAADHSQMTPAFHNNSVRFIGSSGDWYTPSNWTGGKVPGDTTIASIPENASLIIETSDSVASCESLYLRAGAKLTVARDNALNVSNILWLMSDENAVASLIEYDNLTTGNVIIEQFFGENPTDDDNWHYVSMPVNSSASKVFDPQSQMNDVFYWSEPEDSWNEISDNSTDLSVMEGYAVNQETPRFIEYKGNLNSGGVEKSGLSRTNGNYYEGFHLIGNPYPSGIDIQANSGVAIQNLEPTIWYRSDGNFATFNYLSGEQVNGGTGLIPPMQAFWIKVNDNGNGVFKINNESRIHTNQMVYKNQQKKNNRNRLRLVLRKGKLKDETIVYLNQNAHSNFDSYDSEKMFASNKEYPQIYTTADKNRLAINGLPGDIKKTIVPIAIKSSSAGEVSLKVNNAENFNEQYNIYLYDGRIDSLQNLRNENTFYFTVNESFHDTSTFSLIIKPKNRATLNRRMFEEGNVKIFSNRKNLILEAEKAGKINLYIFNLMGSEVFSIDTRIHTGSNKMYLPLKSGIYIVRIKTQNTQITKKIFVN
jgi:hypothetical protein